MLLELPRPPAIAYASSLVNLPRAFTTALTALSLALHPQVVLHVLRAELIGDVLDGILGLSTIYRAFERDLSRDHGDGDLAWIDFRILAQSLADQLLDALIAALVALRPLAAMLPHAALAHAALAHAALGHASLADAPSVPPA